MATKMFSSRLPDATVNAIEARANKRRLSKSEALASLVADAIDMRGRDGLETRIAAMQQTIDEQERIIQRTTGKPTPKRKRVSVALSLPEIDAIDQAARRAGATRAEFLRGRILGGADGRRALQTPTPALPRR